MNLIRFISQEEKEVLESLESLDRFKKAIQSDSSPNEELKGKFLFAFQEIDGVRNFPTRYSYEEWVVRFQTEPAGTGVAQYTIYDPWEEDPSRSYRTEKYLEAYVDKYENINEIIPANKYYWRL